MKKIINAFSVPILESTLHNVEQVNNVLSTKISKLFSSMDDKRLLSHEWNSNILTDQSAVVGYSSFDNSNLVEQSDFADFFQMIAPIITDFFAQLGFVKAWTFQNAWANVYPANAFVPAHNHGTAHWSGSYYVQADGQCGNLILIDPKEYALSHEPNHTKWRGNVECCISVHPGMLVLFPGYLKHHTAPNQSDKERICISFNIICND